MLLHPDSGIRVLRSNFDTTQPGEFGVQARRKILAENFISELFGLMAIDVDTPHTKLSEINPASDQEGPSKPRLLAGPMRLANHDCKPNVEVGSCKTSKGQC